MNPVKTVRILSIDGGGVRGIIPALVLQKLSKALEEKGQYKHYSQLFDLIAGTSTGGILTLGLTVPLPQAMPANPWEWTMALLSGKQRVPKLTMQELVDIYKYQGETIFPQEGMRNRFRGLTHAFREKYSPEPLERLAAEYLGDALLSETLCPVLVTAYDATKMRIQLFRTSRARTKPHQNFYCKDVLRATSAAPTFFEPAKTIPLGSKSALPGRGEEAAMVDGALFANNPSLLAYQEARRIYPFARNFKIISLGTGRRSKPFTYDQMRKWGILEWINPMRGVPMLTMMEEAQNQSVSYTLEHTKGVEYIRFNPDLVGCSTEIDDVSQKNVLCLENLTYQMLEEKSGIFDRMVEVLRK